MMELVWETDKPYLHLVARSYNFKNRKKRSATTNISIKKHKLEKMAWKIFCKKLQIASHDLDPNAKCARYSMQKNCDFDT